MLLGRRLYVTRTFEEAVATPRLCPGPDPSAVICRTVVGVRRWKLHRAQKVARACTSFSLNRRGRSCDWHTGDTWVFPFGAFKGCRVFGFSEGLVEMVVSRDPFKGCCSFVMRPTTLECLAARGRWEVGEHSQDCPWNSPQFEFALYRWEQGSCPYVDHQCGNGSRRLLSCPP